MKDVTTTSFGYVIAFLLPGLFGMYGLGFWSHRVEILMRTAGTADATLGPSLIVLFAALAFGLFLSAARFFLFEKMVCRGKSLDPRVFLLLRDADRLSLFKEIADAHYRYHQFYGGCFVAAPISYLGWLTTSYNELSCVAGVASFAVFLFVELLLWKSAVSSFHMYVARGNMAGTEDQVSVDH